MSKWPNFMPELIKYGSDQTSSATIVSGEDEELGRGFAEGTVRRVKMMVHNNDENVRSVTLAEKVFHNPETSEQQVDIALFNHSELIKRQIPTLPTMRKGNSTEGARLYMTDLTMEGLNAVVSMNDYQDFGGSMKGKLIGSEVALNLSNSEDLSQQFVEIFKRSIYGGVELNSADAFFLIINKEDKRGRIIVGDVANINFHDSIQTIVPSVVVNGRVESNFREFIKFVDFLNPHLDSSCQLNKKILTIIIRIFQKILSFRRMEIDTCLVFREGSSSR